MPGRMSSSPTRATGPSGCWPLHTGSFYGVALAADHLGTVAGEGSYGPYLVDGLSALGETAEINFPTGLALDRAGNLYIADGAMHAIRFVPAVTTTLLGKQAQADDMYTAAGAMSARDRCTTGRPGSRPGCSIRPALALSPGGAADLQRQPGRRGAGTAGGHADPARPVSRAATAEVVGPGARRPGPPRRCSRAPPRRRRAPGAPADPPSVHPRRRWRPGSCTGPAALGGTVTGSWSCRPSRSARPPSTPRRCREGPRGAGEAADGGVIVPGWTARSAEVAWARHRGAPPGWRPGPTSPSRGTCCHRSGRSGSRSPR